MDEQQIALAAGWEDHQTSNESSTPLIDPNDVIDAQTIDNEKPWTAKPLPRLILVGLPTIFITWVLVSFIAPKKPEQAPVAEQQFGEPANAQQSQELQEEIRRLRGQNALQSQAIALKNQKTTPSQLQNQTKKQTPSTQPQLNNQPPPPQPSLPPQTRVVRPDIPDRPTASMARMPVYQSPRQSQVSYSPTQKRKPLTYTPPKITPASPPPVAHSLPTPAPSPSVESFTPQDPQERWDYLASVGSYGSGQGTRSSDSYSVATNVSVTDPQIEVLTGNYNPEDFQPSEPALVSRREDTEFQQAEASIEILAPQDPQVENIASLPTSRLTLGDRANGQLTTPIAWASDLSADGSTAMIELSEHLGDGVIPKGSLVVVKVKSVSESGLIQLEAKMAVINGSEYRLPPGAISVFARGGGYLIGKQRKKSDPFVADLLGAALTGISASAGLVNRPDTRSIVDVDGGAVSTNVETISGQGDDLLAGFVEGSTKDFADSVRNRIKSGAQETQPIWTINSGTKVELLVNTSTYL